MESEHRHAAVAFVRFSGVQRLLDDEGVAAVADAIAEKRPQAVLIDCDHPDLDEGLVDLLRNSSARP